jgi:beta-phosphoglucomutase
LEILGLLLDLDGTLIQTQKANMNAYNVALKEYGLHFSPEEFHLTNGLDSRIFLSEHFPNLLESDIEKIRKIKASVYYQFFSDTCLNKELLNFALHSMCNTSLGIVTTGKRINVFEILDFYGIRSMFDVIVTGDDIVNPKPSPESYLMAVGMLGLRKDQILVFEDSQSGCDAAIAAGLQVFRVTNWMNYEK